MAGFKRLYFLGSSTVNDEIESRDLKDESLHKLLVRTASELNIPYSSAKNKTSSQSVDRSTRSVRLG